MKRIALSLPDARQDPRGFRFTVDGKGFAWSWMERVHPKRARVANPDVIAVRVANQLEKEGLLTLDSAVFFTEPHYDGHPAILVRLSPIDLDLLTDVLTAAWRSRAPRHLLTD